MPDTTDNNHWAIILGGSSGMGLAIAQKMASEGMNICIVHRDRRKNMPLVQEQFEAIRAKGVELLTFNKDALNPAQQQIIFTELKAKLGEKQKIKLVVHAIAKGNLKPIQLAQSLIVDLKKVTQVQDETLINTFQDLAKINQPKPSNQTLSEQDFTLTIQAMATNFYSWVRLLLKADLFAKDSRLIGLTSEGSQRAWQGYAAVSAAKAALEALCRSMAVELAPLGIRCNVVQAGVTDTASLRMIPNSDQLKLHAALRNPLGRLTTPEDVANVVYLLTRPESAWINGAIIPVDGGERIV